MIPQFPPYGAFRGGVQDGARVNACPTCGQQVREGSDLLGRAVPMRAPVRADTRSRWRAAFRTRFSGRYMASVQ
jgi:hypothetical protein